MLIILLYLIIILDTLSYFKGSDTMKSRMGNLLMGMGIGVGSAALYKNVKNGNMKKWVRKMNSAKTKAIDDLEDMI